jgi:hypothetical protein
MSSRWGVRYVVATQPAGLEPGAGNRFSEPGAWGLALRNGVRYS